MPKQEYICKFCNKTFVAYNCRKTIVYCSRPCRNKDYKTRLLSKNNPSFGLKRPKVSNLIGQRFGKLLVVRLGDTISSGGGYKLWCKCDCGHERQMSPTSIKKAKGCKKCSTTFQGVGLLNKSYWNRLIKGAKERNIEFSISMEYAWNLFIKQNQKCALTNDDICMYRLFSSKQTASLDRIDNSKGYIEGNVQWIHKWINFMKSDFSQEEFIEICKKVVAHNT